MRGAGCKSPDVRGGTTITSVPLAPLRGSLAEVEHRIGIAPPVHAPLAAAVYKRSPRDFVVEEVSEAGDVNSIHGYRPAARHRREGGPFVEFTLVKEGLTTAQAVARVARALRVSTGSVTYAGLKDAKAITAQAVRLPRAVTARLHEVDLAQVRLLDPRPAAGPLRVGRLWGNYFTIVLHPVETVDDMALSRLRARLTGDGMPNFFDVQRFGRRLNLHDVGRALATGDEEEACRQFLVAAGEWEPPELSRVRSAGAGLWPDHRSIHPLFARHPALFDLELQLLAALRTSGFHAVWRHPMIGPFSVRAWVAYLFNRLLGAHLDERDALPLFDGSAASMSRYATTLRDEGDIVLVERGRRHLVAGMRPSRVFPVDCFFRREKEAVVMGFALEKGAYATSLLRSAFRLHAADTAHLTLANLRGGRRA